MDTTIIGLIGLILVFTSFTVRNWIWLYIFNMTGTLLLTIYAYTIGNIIFTVLEGGLVVFLTYRLLQTLRTGSKC
ncbi:MAG: hypothetical protein QXR02_02310 [Acidilobaceae archaeon]